jgi:hypothetical protein
MTENNSTDLQKFKKLMNVPFAVIIASSIIILITTNMTDPNALKALIGGYSGLLLGLLFVIILNLTFIKTPYLDMFPIIMIMIIVALLLYYIVIYFDRISEGRVSSYYLSFSIVSLLFLAIQIFTIFNAIYDKTYESNTKLFTNRTFLLLGLFSVINIIIVLTIGIVLHFYSTQG